MWNPTYQEAFNQIKKLVCKDTTLRYFDIRKPVTVQVDASKKDLELHSCKKDAKLPLLPKLLTLQSNDTHTEHEMLACVFGAEWFHTCLWPCIHNREWPQTPGADQPEKPADTPARLQRMLLRLQNYDVTIKVLTWKGDASCWCTVKVLTTDWSRSSTWHSHTLCPHHPREELEFQRTIQDDPLLHTLLTQ